MSERASKLRLEDRISIEQALLRYTRGVDRRDWALVRSAYHPDAFDDHGVYKGGVDGLIEWMQRRHEGVLQAQHFMANTFIEFAGPDSAVVETYVVSRQRPMPTSMMTADAKDYSAEIDLTAIHQTEAWARYVDVFECRDGDWRIIRREVVLEIYDSKQALPDGGVPATFLPARRDADDPLFLARRKAGLDRQDEQPAAGAKRAGQSTAT